MVRFLQSHHDRKVIEVCCCAGQLKRMSEQQIKITLAQLNPTVGDVTGNAAKARAARAFAAVSYTHLTLPTICSV